MGRHSHCEGCKRTPAIVLASHTNGHPMSTSVSQPEFTDVGKTSSIFWRMGFAALMRPTWWRVHWRTTCLFGPKPPLTKLTRSGCVSGASLGINRRLCVQEPAGDPTSRSKWKLGYQPSFCGRSPLKGYCIPPSPRRSPRWRNRMRIIQRTDSWRTRKPQSAGCGRLWEESHVNGSILPPL